MPTYTRVRGRLAEPPERRSAGVVAAVLAAIRSVLRPEWVLRRSSVLRRRRWFV